VAGKGGGSEAHLPPAWGWSKPSKVLPRLLQGRLPPAAASSTIPLNNRRFRRVPMALTRAKAAQATGGPGIQAALVCLEGIEREVLCLCSCRQPSTDN
jgi:hypothetical protein